MRVIISGTGRPANSIADTNVSRTEHICKNLSDISVGDAEWFAVTCQYLFKHKAGTILHSLTGIDERSCQRYAAGSVRPPAAFLRALLRNEGGFSWLCAIMDGCEAVWWQELQAAIDIVSRFKIERR